MCCILTILAWESERHLHTPAPLGPELHLPVCDVAAELVGKCVLVEGETRTGGWNLAWEKQFWYVISYG